MVQVVKWYLSAFHAGRKGSVAKKPYNPILGEVFYCHWDLPNETESPPQLVRVFFTVFEAGQEECSPLLMLILVKHYICIFNTKTVV